MNVPCRDMGNSISANVVGGSSLTAAGTGDNTEVTGANIDLTNATSGKLVITYKTTLTADKTLSFTVKTRTGVDATACGNATAVELQAATVAKTGAATNAIGKVEIDVDLSGYKNFLAFDITPDLSHSGTDTAIWTAAFVHLKPVV